MKRLSPFLLVLTLIPVLAGCYKDDLEPSTWTNNPFDPGYTGPAVFSVDTTYIDVVGAPPNVITQQVVQFRVNSALFLAPNAYQVHVTDLDNGQDVLLGQYPVGNHVFKYTKVDFTIGQELCLEVALSNANSDGRPETICATLQ